MQAATMTWVSWRGKPREEPRAVICRGPYRPTRASAMTRLGRGVGSPIGRVASMSVAIPFLARRHVNATGRPESPTPPRKIGARPRRSRTIVAMLREFGNGVRTTSYQPAGDRRQQQRVSDKRYDASLTLIAYPYCLSLSPVAYRLMARRMDSPCRSSSPIATCSMRSATQTMGPHSASTVARASCSSLNLR